MLKGTLKMLCKTWWFFILAPMAEIQDTFSNLQHTFCEYRNLPSLLSALSFQLQGTHLRGHLDRNLPNGHRTSGANQVSLASHLAYNFLSKMVQVSCRTHDLPAALWMSQVPQGISKSTRHWCISTWLLPHELQGKNLKSNVRMLSCRNIIFRF